MTWDPAVYLQFGEHRLRPGLDLLARIPDIGPRTGIDLGCGTGDLTRIVASRWPRMHLVGLDSSEAMLAAARERGGHGDVEWRHGDIAGWRPSGRQDLIFSNAALHWVDDHAALFARLARAVADGGVLAVQMPDNWAEPTHRVPAQILDGPGFEDVPRLALPRDRVATPADYRRWIGPGFEIDCWTTTYHQILDGPDPVLRWVSGSVLRPVLATLDADRADAFLDACATAYRGAYPQETDGTTLLPFRRLFIVARRG